MGARQEEWKHDPLGRFTYRFWDGSRWTEWVSTAGITTTDPITLRDRAALLRTSVEVLRKRQRFAAQAEPVTRSQAHPGEPLPPPQLQDRAERKTTRGICEARFSHPEIDRERVQTMVDARSLHALMETMPSGWSKGRQAPQFPPVKRLIIPEDCTPEGLDSVIRDWEERETERDKLAAVRIKKWESVVREAWVQVLLAEAVLRELDHPPGKLISQHNTLLGRLESMELSESSIDEQLAARRLARGSLINESMAAPDLIRKLLESTLSDLARLTNATEDVAEGIRFEVASINRDIEDTINNVGRPDPPARALEEPPAWSTWLTATRKHVAKYGPEGPGARLTRFHQQRLKTRLMSVVSEATSQFQERRTSLSNALENAERARRLCQPSGNPRQKPSGHTTNFAHLRTELDAASHSLRQQLDQLKMAEEWLSREQTSLNEKLRDVYLNTTLLDSADRVDAIYQALQAQQSSKFSDHETVVQQAAHDYWIRRCATDAAKKERQRQDSRRAAHLKRTVRQKTERIAKIDLEIQTRTSNMSRLKEAVDAAKKKARRAKEDLDLLPPGSKRRQSLTLRLHRANEDLADAIKRADLTDLYKKRSELENALAVETNELQNATGLRRPGPAPSIGFVADSHEFEKFLASWMRWAGWPDAHVMPIGPDGGVDVRATGALGQAKYWDKPIGIEEVQRHNGVCEGIPNRGRIFLSKNGYTPDAVKFANSAGLVLLAMETDKAGRAKAVGVSKLAKALLIELG